MTISPAATIRSSGTRSETIFRLQQAFKLALSLVLFYWLALWMNWDEPKYGGLAIVIISLGTSGASIEKGLMRMVGTTVGVAVGFLILGLFNHDRWDTLLAFTVYLAVMCYFMQTSRYPYAWYAAAFIPFCETSGQFDDTRRSLENARPRPKPVGREAIQQTTVFGTCPHVPSELRICGRTTYRCPPIGFPDHALPPALRKIRTRGL